MIELTVAEAHQANLETLKAHLPIPYVLERHGHLPAERDSDGKLHYHSPFRDDETPSFDVYSWRGRIVWGDLADPDTPNTSSVIDLLQQLHPLAPLGEIIDIAKDHLIAAIEAAWDGPTVEPTEVVPHDVELMQEVIERMVNIHRAPLSFGLFDRPGLADVDFPHRSPQPWYFDPVAGVIVWVLQDTAGDTITLKFRREDGSKYGIKGGGAHLIRFTEPKPDSPVFLTEGETDTVAATYHLPEYEVLGQPGNSHNPEKVVGDQLDGRIVYLAFDPDESGRASSMKWGAYLADHGCDVRICVLPGKDLSLLRPEDIQRLPERARVRSALPTEFVAMGTHYEAKEAPVSNFTFEPEYLLRGVDGSRSYRGTLRPSGREVTLPSAALQTRSRLRAWSNPHDVVWIGNDYNVGQLQMYLSHHAAFLPEGYVTDQVGLFDGTFVWQDDGQLGSDDKFFAGAVHPLSQEDVFIKTDAPKVDRIAVFEAMLASQSDAVTGPMLAWLAAAPLRTRFQRFPTLGVTGVSGSGKTTLTEEFLRVFSSTNITSNLTSTTPFGIEQMLDSNNGFPVWFDEYRDGARPQTKSRLDQLIRDAYTGQPSMKGTVTNDKQTLDVTRTVAPIVITGEESFIEKSHLDRMVPIRTLVAQQGPLGDLRRLTTAGFAGEYLASLQRSQVRIDDPPVFTDFELQPVEGFNTRQGENLAVLEIGWRLLWAFLQEQDLEYVIPDLNLDGVKTSYIEEANSSPVLDLVRAVLDSGMNDAVQMAPDGEFVWVLPSGLSACTKMFPAITLPTKTIQGLKGVLVEQHNGVSKRVSLVNYAGKRIQPTIVELTLAELGLEKEEADEHYPEI